MLSGVGLLLQSWLWQTPALPVTLPRGQGDAMSYPSAPALLLVPWAGLRLAALGCRGGARGPGTHSPCSSPGAAARFPPPQPLPARRLHQLPQQRWPWGSCCAARSSQEQLGPRASQRPSAGAKSSRFERSRWRVQGCCRQRGTLGLLPARQLGSAPPWGPWEHPTAGTGAARTGSRPATPGASGLGLPPSPSPAALALGTPAPVQLVAGDTGSTRGVHGTLYCCAGLCSSSCAGLGRRREGRGDWGAPTPAPQPAEVLWGTGKERQ